MGVTRKPFLRIRDSHLSCYKLQASRTGVRLVRQRAAKIRFGEELTGGQIAGDSRPF
jgi:hypothetical protein